MVALIIILIVFLLGVVGYICYDKFYHKEETNESKIDVNNSVDVEQNLVIYTYTQMRNYIFTAYDVKGKDVTIYDKYECITGDCSYEYKGDNNYNTSNISLELNEDNVNNYIK